MNLQEAYSILGVSDGITIEQLQKKRKALILEYHPDRNKSPDATKKFIRIKDALEFLTNYLNKPQQPFVQRVIINPYYSYQYSGSTTASNWSFTFS